MPPTSRIDRLTDYLQRQAQAAKEALRQTLYSAVISAGGLLIRDGGDLRVENEDGVGVFVVGRQIFTGVLYQGVTIRRPSGETVFFTAPIDGDPNRTSWSLRDLQATVASDDTSGSGLGRPYLHIPMIDRRHETLSSTDSTGWSDLVSAWDVERQHPVWEVSIRHTSTASDTAGDVRVVLDGAQVGATIPVTWGWGTAYVQVQVPGAHLSRHTLSVQGRRTSGTARVGADAFITARQS